MLHIFRGLAVLSLAIFLTTGATLAQAPPNQMPPPQGAQSGGHSKCGQTAKGCHKNQAKPAAKPQNKCGQTPKGCHKNQAKPPAGAPPRS
jgi:hypothetical protein